MTLSIVVIVVLALVAIGCVVTAWWNAARAWTRAAESWAAAARVWAVRGVKEDQ